VVLGKQEFRMSRSATFKLLLLANVALAGWLAWGLHQGQGAAAEAAQAHLLADAANRSETTQQTNVTATGTTNLPPTPFAQVYSDDPKTFAQNLRAIGCPDQTIRDIITAEVHRRFKAQEEALRPTPADHVPFAWSARTTEARLLERRVQAGMMARQEAGLLREALGCEATVPMPIYAMTSSDQQFEGQLSASPGIDTCSVRQLQDTYWNDVQALLERTKGFWLPDDVAELQALKERRRQALGAFLAGK
jgi:hypothetical protein